MRFKCDDKVTKALKNVTTMMEKQSERQLITETPDPEFTPKEAKPKYDPKSRGNNGAWRLEHMECEERVIIEQPALSEAELSQVRFIRIQDRILYRVIPNRSS